MATPEAPDATQFEVAMDSHRTLKDLRARQPGQPVCVVGSGDDRKGKEGVFQHFNVRLAVVKFPDGKTLGYDPLDLLLPCEIHEDGEAFFEIRTCAACNQIFPLTSDEFRAEQERTECPECQP
ncbi:MAG: hypothetical protein OXF97_10240 [Nitrospira sp.]|nr:hypothetical protein [Nitrospira sp.]MCY3956402.1 hypothetical protein [Nitrospira sp.]MCY4131793.1 hypothetical protein [Nitrospira sp.]